MTDDPVVAVPAELELEERLIGPVTFRMAAWLALAAAGAVLIALGPGRAMSLPLGLPMVGLGAVGAFWLPAGRPASSWIAPVWSYWRRVRSDRQPDDDNLNSDMPERREWPSFVRSSCARPATPRRVRLVATAATALLLASGGFVGGRLLHARQVVASSGDQLATNTAPTPSPAVTSAPTREQEIAPMPAIESWWTDCGC